MNKHQQPEGKLIAQAQKNHKLGNRAAAARARMSEGRWRQIVNGQLIAGGQVIPVIGPAETLARMARAVDVTPDAMRAAGRADVAETMALIAGAETEAEWLGSRSLLTRLNAIHRDLGAVIADWPSEGTA